MQDRKSFLRYFRDRSGACYSGWDHIAQRHSPGRLQVTSDNPTPLGYTWSLLLFIVPIGALGWWFASRLDLKFPRKAFWRTLAVLTPLGFALDLLFGNAFFIFPNKAATLGWEIPALGGAIPIEEFVFYLAGFMLVLLSYIWCDEYWMEQWPLFSMPYLLVQLPVDRQLRDAARRVGVGILFRPSRGDVFRCRKDRRRSGGGHREPQRRAGSAAPVAR